MNKMENNTANQGIWDNVDVTAQIRPKIVFEFNIPQTIKFPENFDKPKEYPGEKGNYCVFEVIHEGEPAAIITSAYSMLRGLKKLMPLANKTVRIVKRLDKGKQSYEVELLQ